MSLGQSMLTAAALIIITVVVITANRLILESQQDQFAGEAYHLASEMANSMLMEAAKKLFDANVKTSYYQSASEFTSPQYLGPSSSEQTAVPLPDTFPFKSIGGYNDFDDYHRYERIVDSPLITGFQMRDSVFYVKWDNLDTPQGYQQYLKKMVVRVLHPLYLTTPLYYSTVSSY